MKRIYRIWLRYKGLALMTFVGAGLVFGMVSFTPRTDAWDASMLPVFKQPEMAHHHSGVSASARFVGRPGPLSSDDRTSLYSTFEN